jgi:hypothetical protein
MQMKPATWLFAIAGIGLLLLWGALFAGCGGNGTGVNLASSGHARMTLDSGVDKKTARPEEYNESAAETSGYDSNYREKGGEPAASATPNDASAQAKDSYKLKSQLDSAPGFSDPAGLLQTWLIPQAYAQDHKLDERYLKRTGSCSLQVDKYKDASDRLTALAITYGGMVSGVESSRGEDDSMGGVITLRVPSAKFAQAWADVLAIGKVLSEKVTTEDVSHDYLGYVSHMKNLLSEQAALEKMLSEALAVQRARGLGEGYKILLDTQERLFAVTGELESTEDSLNALADQITRSTLVVQLTERKQLPQQVTADFTWGMGTTAAQAFQDLRVSLRGWGQGLVYFIITCWTWIIPWAIFFLLARWFYRRYMVPRGYHFPALLATVSSGGMGQLPPTAAAPEQSKDEDPTKLS